MPNVAAPIDDVRKNKAVLQKDDEGPSVKEVQKMLAAKGYPLQVNGKYGAQTEGVVKDFQKDNNIEQNGKVGGTTLKVIEAPAPKAGNLSSPWLKTLATSTLNPGDGHMCVTATYDNMTRLKVSVGFKATDKDGNNPRGALVQMIMSGLWTSLQIPGSKLRSITSPYGTVQAYVIDAASYTKLASAGKMPSGAIIFETKWGWDYGKGSKGNDMGIVRDGGKSVFNYQDNPIPLVYPTDAKDVVLLIPK